MAALPQVQSTLCTSINVGVRTPTRTSPIYGLSFANNTRIGTTFAAGSPLLIRKPRHQNTPAHKTASVSIRSEQSAKEASSLDIWLGRLAMVGFAVAISVEIATGKGLLENFGLTTPLPTVALAITALVGVLTAIFIFQSASKN